MKPFFDSIRNAGFRRGPNRVLGGVCGGIARQWNLDVTLVRIIVAVLLLLPVVSWGVYLAAWVVLPWQDGSIPAETLLTGREHKDGPGAAGGTNGAYPPASDGVQHVWDAEDR